MIRHSVYKGHSIMSDCGLLIDNIDKIHTTKMGIDNTIITAHTMK